VSTNRAPVQLLAIEPVAGTEPTDLALDASLLSLLPRDLDIQPRQRPQVLRHERADGCAPFRRAEMGGTVDIVGNGNGDVGHCQPRITETQRFRSDTLVQ